MRVFVAGAGGAVGQRLIPLLLQAGHTVAALTRSENKRESLSGWGVTPFIADALNVAAVKEAVEAFKPEVIVNQLTAIPQSLDLRNFDREFALTNRLRREGTDNLIVAAKSTGVTRFVAQGFAGSPYARTGSLVKTEEDPFDPDPPEEFRSTFEALRYLESSVLGNFPEGGVVLRYGWFYGPGTSLSKSGSLAKAVRSKMLPIVARGTGLWSFVHIDDAASATLAALQKGAGVYNVTDNDPALVRDWITLLAQLLGAKAPSRVPGWIARPMIGRHGVALMKDNRGVSNAKAKQELGWKPSYPSWKDGFRREFGN